MRSRRARGSSLAAHTRGQSHHRCFRGLPEEMHQVEVGARLLRPRPLRLCHIRTLGGRERRIKERIELIESILSHCLGSFFFFGKRKRRGGNELRGRYPSLICSLQQDQADSFAVRLLVPLRLASDFRSCLISAFFCFRSESIF